VAHAAPDGAVRIPNGRKALRLQPHFSELRLKVGAAVYARIQIDVHHMGYVVEIAYGHGLYIIYCIVFIGFIVFIVFIGFVFSNNTVSARPRGTSKNG
jgi:hypothetical protein